MSKPNGIKHRVGKHVANIANTCVLVKNIEINCLHSFSVGVLYHEPHCCLVLLEHAKREVKSINTEEAIESSSSKSLQVELPVIPPLTSKVLPKHANNLLKMLCCLLFTTWYLWPSNFLSYLDLIQLVIVYNFYLFEYGFYLSFMISKWFNLLGLTVISIHVLPTL